jgi:hypothetical protein
MITGTVLRRLVLLLAVDAGILHAALPSLLAQARADAVQPGDSILRKSAHAKLVCVACHTSLDPGNLATAKTVAPVNCLRCHADAQFKHDFHPELSQAIRADRAPRVACKDCHGSHDVASPSTPGTKFHRSRIVESCGQCHKRAAENFPGSAHGAALAAGAKGAPTCLSCHRARVTLSGGTADSISLKTDQASMCLTCHQDTPDARAKMPSGAKFVPAWDSSTHGLALKHDKVRAANCVGCHGSHEIRKASDSTSRVSHAVVTNTCGSCHADQKKTFGPSVHGLARNHAKADSLVCSTCHGEHGDPLPLAPRPAAKTDTVRAQICQRCHNPVVLSGRYGLASDRFREFTDSYHGLTRNGNSFVAANCASCHTAHDVRPVTDSASSVARANRVAMCGKCHHNAIARFSRGPVHDTTSTRLGAVRPTGRSPLVLAGLILVIAALVGAAVFLRTRRRTPQVV